MQNSGIQANGRRDAYPLVAVRLQRAMVPDAQLTRCRLRAMFLSSMSTCTQSFARFVRRLELSTRFSPEAARPMFQLRRNPRTSCTSFLYRRTLRFAPSAPS